MELLDLIQHENEKTGLDFKAAIYKSEKFDELLKDLMAMANATLAEDRYIVVGVKHHPNGERVVLGIEEFMDDATYYQLVHSNIEPDIQFEYFHTEVEGKKVGVFRIFNCDNQPYLMKKDTKTLRRGDGFIRKGSSQTRLMRSDLDKIFAKRQVVPDLAAKLDAAVEVNGELSTRLTPALDTGLPSASAARKIRQVIADKGRTEAEREARKQAMLDKKLPGQNMLDFISAHPALQQASELAAQLAKVSGHSLSYEQRDVATLQEDLRVVEETYLREDQYYHHEERAQKINFILSNHGDRYIENSSVEIRIGKSFGLDVAPKLYRKPDYRTSYLASISGPDYEALDYPKVTETEDYYRVTAQIGDLRHGHTTRALKVPLRLTLPVNTAGQQVDVTLTLFGKNLPTPFVKSLRLQVG